MMRFIENHDEPRAFATMGLHKGMAAATLICTLPGACLLHDGQFSGRKVKLPVQIKRGPDEPMQEELYTFYLKLLKETRSPIYQTGQWYLFEATPAGEGDHTWMNLLVYGWREIGTNWRLMVVNLTDRPSYARVPLRFWDDLANERWILHDVIDGERYERDGNRMRDEGLFVALQPYESHIFRFERVIHLELETTEMLQYQQQVKQAARPKGVTGELRLKAEETQK